MELRGTFRITTLLTGILLLLTNLALAPTVTLGSLALLAIASWGIAGRRRRLTNHRFALIAVVYAGLLAGVLAGLLAAPDVARRSASGSDPAAAAGAQMNISRERGTLEAPAVALHGVATGLAVGLIVLARRQMRHNRRRRRRGSRGAERAVEQP